MTASEAAMSAQHARREDVTAQEQAEEVVAHELKEGGVCASKKVVEGQGTLNLTFAKF